MTKSIKRLHLRIAIGGVILMVALLLWFFALSAGAATVREPGPDPVPVAVRFAEGTVHGFLQLETVAGAPLAHGDLLQVPKDGAVESRMVFHFSNSVFEESVAYTQRNVFSLQRYHLVQSGPAFDADIDATLARSGAYTVISRSHKDGKEKTFTGTLSLPPDTYNGMVIVVAKNLASGPSHTIHVVAFTPEPRIIDLEIAPMGQEHVLLGKHEEATTAIALKPHLGTMLRFFATVKGQSPPDSRVWIVTDQVPAFVRFEGPMYSGPIWRLNLTSPSWPK